MNLQENYLKLAKNLVHYSCSIKKGEKVLIEQQCVDENFIVCLINEIRHVGAYPFIINKIPSISKAMLWGMSEEHAKLLTKYMLPIMKDMDVYIGFRGANNLFEESDVPADFKQILNTYYHAPVHFDERVNGTKWCVLIWPNECYAQSAGVSSNVFKDLYFQVCTMDYGKMDKAMDNLVALMERTDKVRIVTKQTDLTFSIKGQKAVKCSGNNNIPDGEVFTSPIRDSLNGKILYNIPTVYLGDKYENVEFEIKNGKIIKAYSSNKTQKLNEILDTDTNSRYFGEFAIGVNPFIKKPMLDILFDEKMCGSIHLTPGNCYDEAPNGNKSSIHWDMVLCQLPEFGGGEIYFDDILIRKDGKFVLPELASLNPENLI